MRSKNTKKKQKKQRKSERIALKIQMDLLEEDNN